MKKRKKDQRRIDNSWAKKPVFWILLLAAFLRFYKLPDLFHWTLDEEFWAYIPFNIATGYHIPLIGGPISGTGLYLGPLFVWLMALPFWLTGGDPLGAALVVSTLGVLTTALIFWAGKSLFDKGTGLVAALLSASAFLMVIYDRKYWNASPIPLFSILTLICLYNIAKGRLRWTYILAVVLAFAFHSHMTSGVLLLLVPVSWILLKLSATKKEIYQSMGIFLVLQLPLLLFELRHQFLNSKALISFLTKPKTSTPLFAALIDVSRLILHTISRIVYMPPGLDIANELTLCTQYADKRYFPPMAFSVIVLISLWFVWKKRKSLGAKLLLLTISINSLTLLWFRINANQQSWYAGQLNEYYLLPSFPALFLSVGFFLSSIIHKLGKKSYLITLPIAAIILINISAVLTVVHGDGYAMKKDVVGKVVSKIGKNPFSLTVESDDPCRIYGYRYLFSYFGKEPVQSYLDPQFNWLYERRLAKQKPRKAIVITSGLELITFTMEDFERKN